jgi:ribonuclease D
LTMNKTTYFDRKPVYTVVESAEHLERFYLENKDVEWLAFDTEFIPEKYFKSKLCLISAATSRGNYILDALKIGKMNGFLRLIEDPRILKITHAGENDYQILVTDYKARPRNIFDTQLSYGFLNRDYPLGLQYLVEKELKIRMNKGELRSDWEQRPLTAEQLEYAIGDVISLYPLMKVLKRKLKRNGKLAWAKEENSRWEKPGYFTGESMEFLTYLYSISMRGLNRQQKAFLLRLHRWRYEEAARRNCPLSHVLKTWLLNTIVRNVKGGKPALLKDRTIPDGIVHHYWPMFDRFYSKKPDANERELMTRVQREENDDHHRTIVMDMLYPLIKLKALDQGISPNLVLSKREMNKMKADRYYYPPGLNGGWRRELLGPDLLQWLKKRNPIDITVENNTCILKMQKRNGFSTVFISPKKNKKEQVKGFLKRGPLSWLFGRRRKKL